jgi:hypothetical protein
VSRQTSKGASEAGLEFICRDLRLHHPDGAFDDGGRFYPSEKEVRHCRAILEETRKHGILKRQVWDSLFAALDDYEKRWHALKT